MITPITVPEFTESSPEKLWVNTHKEINHEQIHATDCYCTYYQKDLEGAYPKPARALGYLDSSLANRNPSLYELDSWISFFIVMMERSSERCFSGIARSSGTSIRLFKRI